MINPVSFDSYGATYTESVGSTLFVMDTKERLTEAERFTINFNLRFIHFIRRLFLTSNFRFSYKLWTSRLILRHDRAELKLP